MDDNALMASLALLGLMFTIGAIVLLRQRDKRREMARKQGAEQRLTEWIEQQRAKGVDAQIIADQLDAKRAEFEQRNE